MLGNVLAVLACFSFGMSVPGVHACCIHEQLVVGWSVFLLLPLDFDVRSIESYIERHTMPRHVMHGDRTALYQTMSAIRIHRERSQRRLYIYVYILTIITIILITQQLIMIITIAWFRVRAGHTTRVCLTTSGIRLGVDVDHQATPRTFVAIVIVIIHIVSITIIIKTPE